jgi:hypothetical protein
MYAVEGRGGRLRVMQVALYDVEAGSCFQAGVRVGELGLAH